MTINSKINDSLKKKTSTINTLNSINNDQIILRKRKNLKRIPLEKRERNYLHPLAELCINIIVSYSYFI